MAITLPFIFIILLLVVVYLTLTDGAANNELVYRLLLVMLIYRDRVKWVNVMVDSETGLVIQEELWPLALVWLWFNGLSGSRI